MILGSLTHTGEHDSGAGPPAHLRRAVRSALHASQQGWPARHQEKPPPPAHSGTSEGPRLPKEEADKG